MPAWINRAKPVELGYCVKCRTYKHPNELRTSTNYLHPITICADTETCDLHMWEQILEDSEKSWQELEKIKKYGRKDTLWGYLNNKL